ncbi:MAG: hypothetical protein ISR50_01815 [Alphaproteobacteria bacterium]|nr:hypothetical protein [Alphaproteobacteria bacterium]MBL6951339.1 hypothetical protein [Alphaproteobacteria bacterium]
MRLLDLDAIGADFVQTLFEAQVRFLIVGGVAVNFYVQTRPAHDLDILSEPTSKNATRLASALRGFSLRYNKSFQFTDCDLSRLGKPWLKLPLWSEDDFVGIDILTSINDVSFDEAYRQALLHRAESLTVRVLSRDHLIRSKWEPAQLDEKHLADIRALKALTSDTSNGTSKTTTVPPEPC